MKILVTGGAGYIGSVTAAQLLEAGHEVVILDNLSRGRTEAVPSGAKLIQADITDLAKVITKNDAIDAVFHFAAYCEAGEAAAHPELYWRNNTINTLLMLDAMRELDIRRIIFSSTCFTYGNVTKLPITEKTIPNPINPYGDSKLATDLALRGEAVAHGLAAISFRYFNVAGAYKDHGEYFSMTPRIIPLAIAAAENGTTFKLFGDDYPTADGTCVRDYIHVADIARAHMMALPKLEAGKHNIFNLGTGHGFSNREIIKAVETVIGKPVKIEVTPRREGDPATLVASSDKAKQTFGWEPENSSLERIITDTLDFYRQTNAK